MHVAGEVRDVHDRHTAGHAGTELLDAQRLAARQHLVVDEVGGQLPGLRGADDPGDRVRNLLVNAAEERIHRMLTAICREQRFVDRGGCRELKNRTTTGGKADRMLDLDICRVRGRDDEMPLVFTKRKNVEFARDSFWEKRKGERLSLGEVRFGESERWQQYTVDRSVGADGRDGV